MYPYETDTLGQCPTRPCPRPYYRRPCPDDDPQYRYYYPVVDPQLKKCIKDAIDDCFDKYGKCYYSPYYCPQATEYPYY